MEKKTVKDLMVPIEEYATVKIGTSLLGAILALEKAQEAYTDSKYQHRAILVMDEKNKVVGKIGQLRVLKAVETRYDLNEELDDLGKFGFSEKYLNRSREIYRLKGPILNKESLKSAAERPVEEFMQQPTPGEFVSEDCSLDIAIHRLVAGTHLSLLVTREEEIVGVLKMADVFAAVSHEMREAAME
ncbi:CBS domain-containing protein [Desulfosediminicola ganghwensis]|uniref:CBS domain-containing protein n=1 Tax=Desulfosediminicola ganghwensis TaxID=2569540 RepID=UPI0010AB8F0E|nr:CBS domain-containing protein [Desulfosediminicola ganghwensis]